MGTISKEDYELIHGRGVGNSLSEAINSAEDKIWIISPWISAKYAKLLKRKYKEEDVNVKLLTSNQYNSSHKKGLRKLLKAYRDWTQNPIFSKNKEISLGLISTGSLLTLIGLSAQSVFTLLLGLTGIGSGFYVNKMKPSIKYKQKIPFTVFKGGFHSESSLTHSKVYLLDDKVYIGSANLTESGLWENIEVLFHLKDEELKDTARDIFDNIENSVETEEVDLHKVAEKVYEDVDLK